MGDWLHCNTCYKQPGDGRCYFLTSCGHLYCESCKNRGWLEKCLLCGTNKPSALKLTAKLTPPVDAYFSEPLKMLKQVHTQVKQVIATMEFQHHQRKRYVSQLQKIVSHQKQIVEQQERELKTQLQMKMDAMEKELMKLKDENSYLKRLIREKGHGSLRSPSSHDRCRPSTSPVHKGYGSPGVMHEFYRSSSTSSLHKKISPGSGVAVVTMGRVSVRTPPSDGKMGVIPRSTPSPMNYISKLTPMSVPHPIGFDVNMETPPR